MTKKEKSRNTLDLPPGEYVINGEKQNIPHEFTLMFDGVIVDPPSKWPQIGDTYYFPSFSTLSYTWENDGVDKERIALGLVFRTAEEYQKWGDKQKLLTQIKNEPGYLDKCPEHGVRIWQIYYDRKREIFDFFCFRDHWTPGALHFETKEQAQSVLGKYGERLKILLS